MTTTLASVLIGFLGLGGAEMTILTLPLLLSIIPMIFYLITMQNTFNEISPENRKMEAGLVWLTLIPLFGLVWQFIIVNRMADSLKLEFAKRNIKEVEDRPGISLGLTFCILFACSIIPLLGFLTGIAGLVCWIIYWVKINGFKVKLQQNRPA